MPDYIPSDEMYKYIDCRYTGVVVAAKRARQLMVEDPTNVKGKPLLRAFDDLMQGRLQYRFIEHSSQDEIDDSALHTEEKGSVEGTVEEQESASEGKKGTAHRH